MKLRNLVLTIASAALALGALAPLAGAADNSGTPVDPSSVLGASATAVPADVTVALFFDSNYMGTNPGGSDEGYNVQQTLLDQGFTVNDFSGITTAEWTAALTGADVLVVPEMESGDLVGDLEPGALTAIQDFVNGGGRMITFSDNTPNFELMEAVLGIADGTLDSNQGCPCTKTAAATGTEWESGPATLASMNATNTLDIDTAPVGTSAIYADDDDATEAGIAVIPLGSGDIVYYAWDWFFDSEETEDFQSWFDVLGESVLAAAPAPTPAPEPVVVVPAFTG